MHTTRLQLPVGWFLGDSDLSIFILSWPHGKLRAQLPSGYSNGQMVWAARHGSWVVFA